LGCCPYLALLHLHSKKVYGNCHVTDVIICSMGDVHYNVCCSKSKAHKLGFLWGSIATNDEPILFTIEGKWLEIIVHITSLNSWIWPIQNKFNSSFQFVFVVNFNYRPHLPILVPKETRLIYPKNKKTIWVLKG
jgi:hypothetical protein